MFKILVKIFKEKRFKIVAFGVLIFYLFVYLFATQQIIIEKQVAGIFNFLILDNWQDLIFKQRSGFLFEFIGVLHIFSIKFFLSIPNILLAFVLGILVSLNMTVSYFSFRALGLRGGRGAMSLFGTIPAIVSGVVCCVPTLILVIGLQFTATLAAIWSWLVPVSIILLIATLFWSLKKYNQKLNE